MIKPQLHLLTIIQLLVSFHPFFAKIRIAKKSSNNFTNLQARTKTPNTQP